MGLMNMQLRTKVGVGNPARRTASLRVLPLKSPCERL